MGQTLEGTPMKLGPIVKTAAQAGKLAVKYGPQAKIAWDKGGKQGAAAARKRAMSLNARRKALKHASGLVEGSVLKVAPQGRTVYVVFTGERPVAAYPVQELPFAALIEHADLTKRIRPERPGKGLEKN
jgi:hypothetical protein